MALTTADLQAIAKETYGVAGTVWHVAPSGNDTTGDGLSWATAYATPSKAKSVASSGDRVIVAAGTYTDGDLLKDGVHWHFERGAKVYSTAQNDGIFNDIAAACTCRITGWGQFRHDTDTQCCINITRNGTDLDIECESLSLAGVGDGGTLTPVHIGVNLTTARLRLRVNGDVTNPWYDGMILDSGRVDIDVRGKIESTAPTSAGGEALELGPVFGIVRARRLRSTGSAAIFSTNADLIIDCPDIRGAGGDFYTSAVEIAAVSGTSDAALRIRNARVIGEGSCRAVHFHDGGGTFGSLILENCDLESGASDGAASAVASQTIRILGRLTTDKAFGTNVTARYDTVLGSETATLADNLSSIRAQTDKITSSNVFVVNRIARGEITIHQGDSYSSTGLTLAIPKPDGATYPADLTGWTVTLQANLRDTTGATGTTHFSVALTVTNPATTQDLTLDNLPASTTSTLEVGNADQAAAWDFQIVATKGSDAVTLIEGPLTVVKRQAG